MQLFCSCQSYYRSELLLHSAAMTELGAKQHYNELDPDTIISAVESLGYLSDHRILALNSYENRVYQVGIEAAEPIIVKFYRPERWSNQMIQEEHDFTRELLDAEIPVVAPISINKQTLFEFEGYRFAIYPRFGGYAPELDNPEHLLQLGRILARIHNIGDATSFEHRPTISIEAFAKQPSEYLLQHDFIPMDLLASYSSVIEDLIKRITTAFDKAGDIRTIRLHGDCHHGNVLTRDDQFYVVDFDDARTGPTVQDIWMFLSGDRQYMTARLYDILDGYIEFREFDPRELHLIEALRSLRIIHYSAWLAARWDDPAFPIAFPYFNTQRYWEDHVLALREQSALLDEAPLDWRPD